MQLLKRLATAVRLVLFTASCIVAALAILLLAVERSGWLTAIVQGRIAEKLGDLGAELSLEHVELRWFRPSIELHGLSLGPDGRLLHLDRTVVTLGRDPATGRPGVQEVRVDGGEVQLGVELRRVLDRFRGSSSSRSITSPDDVLRMPEVTVRDIDANLSHPEWGELSVGRIDLRLFRSDEGRPTLHGRVFPALAAGIEGESEIHLGGHMSGPREFEVRALASSLPIAVQSLPEGTVLEIFRAYEPRGVLALEASGTISLDATRPVRGVARASIREASFLPPGWSTRVEELRAEVEIRYTTPRSGMWWSPDAWDGAAELDYSWGGMPLEGRAVFGRTSPVGSRAAGRVVARRLPLTEELLETLGLEERQRAIWDAFEPEGTAELCVGFRVPFAGEDLRPEVALELLLDGKTNGAYRGWKRRTDGAPLGLPLPLKGLTGRVIGVFDPKRSMLGHLGLLDLRGEHPGGGALVNGTVAWISPHDRLPGVELMIESPSIPLDENLRDALDGLVVARWIWPDFQPSAGTISGSCRIHRRPGAMPVSARIELGVHDASFAWSGLPLAARSVDGRLGVTIGAGQGVGLSFDAQGELPTADSVRIRGRLQDDPARTAAGHPRDDRRLLTLEVVGRNLSLRGADRDTIASTYGGVDLALDEVSPAGKVDVIFHGRRALPGGGFDFDVEILPRQVRMTPRAFPIPTSDVRGRVLVNGRARPLPGDGAGDGPAALEIARWSPEVVTRLSPLAGVWTGGVAIAAMASFPDSVEGQPAPPSAELHLVGAGIDPSNLNLIGALSELLEADEGQAYGGVELSDRNIDGRVDATADIRLPSLGSGSLAGASSIYRIHLRDNTFRLFEEKDDVERESFRLERLRGIVERSGPRLYGEEIQAVLGSTPVLLRSPRFTSGDGEYLLETGLSAELPIDREHLRYFLTEETLETLIEQSEWSGQIDTEDVRLRLSGRAGGSTRVELDGRVYPVNMFVRLGIPTLIQSASVDLRSLVFESGQVTASAFVDDLYGRVAGRQLQHGRMQVTYVEPRLALQDLDAELEGGRILDQRSSGALSGDPFSIDLQKPFPFNLAVRLEAIDVEGLLRGVFESNLANRGTVDAAVRLTGSLERLSSIYGSGQFTLRDARLWSIPVVRDLFSLFGFDGSAVFESFGAEFVLDDGVVEMSSMQVKSPLIDLVGEGTLDLDGTMRQDYQPRFGFVEKLPFLKRLGRSIQSSLLTIQVRGDMARPRVYKTWLLTGLFAGFGRDDPRQRDLPLPDFSPIPERF